MTQSFTPDGPVRLDLLAPASERERIRNLPGNRWGYIPLGPGETPDSTPNVRLALTAAEGTKADDIYTAKRHARELGVAEGVAQYAPEAAKANVEAKRLQSTPELAQWASMSTNNAAMARDDMPAMQALHKAVNGEIKAEEPNIFERIPLLLQEGSAQVGQSLLGFLSGLARTMGTTTFTDSDGAQQEARSELLHNIADTLDAGIRNMEKRMPARLQAESTVGGYAQDVVRMAPQLLSQIGATMVGAPWAGMSMMGAQIAGGQYNELTNPENDKPVDSDRAFAAGLANAALQAPLEQLGLSKLAGIFKTSGAWNVFKRTVEGMFAEGGTEFLQAFPQSATDIWARLQEDEGAREWLDRFVSDLPQTVKEGLYEAAVAAPFGLLGGIGKASYDAARQRRAQEWAGRQMAQHERVEDLQAKQQGATDTVEELLRVQGMTEEVTLSAADIVQLYQSGTDIITPMGWNLEELETAAALGEDLTAPLAQLHANLDKPQFDAVAGILRENPDAVRVADADTLQDRIQADVEQVRALYQQDAQAEIAITEERDRLREEMRQAVANAPGLRAQAEALAGGVDSYVDAVLAPMEAFARRMAAVSGEDAASIFHRVTLDRLRASRTPEQNLTADIAADLESVQGEFAPEAETVDTATATAEEAQAEAAPPRNAPVVHEGVASVDDLYRVASEAQPAFNEALNGLAAATGGEAMLRPGDGLKSRERAQQKVDSDYGPEGANRVVDVLGGTLLYDNRAAVEAALPVIEQEVQRLGGEVVRVKNRFERPSAGYRDYLLNIRMPNGFVTEVLLTTKAMSEAKEGIGHKLYEAYQATSEALEKGILEGDERKAAEDIQKEVYAAMVAHYESTGEESNLEASSSVIQYPLNKTSAVLPFLSSSSLYPSLESLLGNIWKSLPSEEKANRKSSYSKNSSINTGSFGVPFSQGTPDRSLPSSERTTGRFDSSRSRNGAISGSEQILKNLSNGLEMPSTEANARLTTGPASGSKASMYNFLERSANDSRALAITNPPVDTSNITQNEAESKSLPAQNAGRVRGADTVIAGSQGREAAHYELREMADVIPSHDPLNGFAKRADYPEGVQERPYHSDPAEQNKVREHALKLDPIYLVTDNPDATNGPSIITESGVVLGGNSRAMSIQQAYASNPERANIYREAIKAKAAQFGFDPAAVDAMQQPMLVRVVDGDMDAQQMAVKSRLYNETPTQALQTKAEGVSRAKMLSERSLNLFAEGMAEYDTLREFTGKPASRAFVESLLADGVIEKTKASTLIDQNTGLLTDDGKALVENALRGLVVADYDTLNAAAPSVLQKLDRSVPALVQLKARGEGWDMSGVVTRALQVLNAVTANKQDMDTALGQGSLLQGGNPAQAARPAVQAMALTFEKATQKEIAARFAHMVEDSRALSETDAQGLLGDIAPENTPATSFVASFLKPVVTVGGNPVRNFDPTGNPMHAALAWAIRHGGKGRTVEGAQAELEKTMRSKKASKEEKLAAREMIGQLVQVTGAVAEYQPRLGGYFSYQQGQPLWQRDAEGNSAEARLAQDAEAWGKTVDDFIAGRLNPRKSVTILSQTPLVLSLLGANKDLRVNTDYGKLKKILQDKHKLPESVLKQLPTAMADPIMIFDSATMAGDYVMMLDLKDENVATVVVPISFDYEQGRGYMVNYVPSVYAQKDTNTGKPKDWWFSRQVEEGKLRYVNKRKAAQWASSSRLQLPWVGTHLSGKKKVLTEADLVKEKGRHGNILYQREQSGPRGSMQIYPENYLISLFEGANLSTLLHETGHVFFEEMERLAGMEGADAALVRDFDTLREWVGAQPGQGLSIPQKEQLARGFEAWLREGKAPSRELEGAFARFRRWLMQIYKSAVQLQVQLTDEVRGVFGRMLSTEQELADAAARNELIDLTERELDALGLTGAEREYAGGLMQAAQEAASIRMQQARERGRKERRARFTQQATNELRDTQTYRTRGDMRKTPLDIDAVKANFGEDVARDLMRKMPATLKELGEDPEIFAAEHGYESAAAMLEDMRSAPTLRDAVAARVAEMEAEHDARQDALDYLFEAEETTSQIALVGQYLARNTKSEHVQQEAFRRAASEELWKMPAGKALQSGNFAATMRRALATERRAIGKGDFGAALEANYAARLNLELAKQSRELARNVEKLENSVKRFTAMQKGDADARYTVNDIAARYGLAKANPRLAEGRDGTTIRDWLETARQDGYEIFADDAVLYGAGKHWREATVAELDAVGETIRQIITVERNRRKLFTEQAKQDLDEAAAEIAATIRAHRASKPVKTVEEGSPLLDSLASYHAFHMKVEAICRALDGDKLGVAWNYIYKPVNEAEDRQALRFREARDTLRGMFAAYTQKELHAMGQRRELVQEVGETLSWENRLAVALNMGNAENIERIRAGHGWTDEQIAAVLRPLTARDWNFVQSVWDYLETFKEESFQLEEDVTGLRPKAVEAKPLVVQTADGQSLELKGGYYPIAYNRKKSLRQQAFGDKEVDKELFGGRNYGAAMTKHGHLKARSQGGEGTPLNLHLSVVTDHVFNTIHDLCYRKAVLDVAKIIRHKAVQAAFTDTGARHLYRQLMPWLQSVANEHQAPMGGLDKMASWARAATSVMTMGLKATTIVAQPFGITQTMEMLGYKYTGIGLKTVYGNPAKLPQLWEETAARSSFMASRLQSFDREVRDITKDLMPGMGRFKWVQVLRDKAFVPMGFAQMGVDLPTWWGAYAKGLAENAGDERLAAQYADHVVRMSQGSGATKDLSRIQRGTNVERLFTMFYSYFNTFYNLGARRIAALRDHHSPADIFMAANAAMLLWFIPAVFTELAAGRGPGDDDDDWLKWSAMQLMQYPFQTMIGVREVASGIFGEYGYTITPAQSAPKSFVKWAKAVEKAIEEEDAAKLAKPTAEAVGYALRLPMKQMIITTEGMWNFLTDERGDAQVRDLFFTKPQGRR